MGFRAIIRDIVAIYLGFRIIVLSFDGSITNDILIMAIILLVLSTWFFLERFGIIPRIT